VPLADGAYPIRLTARDTTDGTVLFGDTKLMRVRCADWRRLDANDPEGFCPTLVPGTPQGTTVDFFCAEAGDVRLEVWSQDSSHVGRTLDDGSPATGRHQVPWDGLDDGGGVLANGGYPYVLTAIDTTLCGVDFTDSTRATIACVASATPGPARASRALILAR
jgi:hypothetical protein